MRRFLTALVLASLLVTTFPATYAQRAAEKSKKAAASVTAQRGVDTISANQIRDYLTFICFRRNGRTRHTFARTRLNRKVFGDEPCALGIQTGRRRGQFLSNESTCDAIAPIVVKQKLNTTDAR